MIYTVQFGDTLTHIAQRFRVKGGYPALAESNDLWDADDIEGGQRLKIPATVQARETLSRNPASTPFKGTLEACGAEALDTPRPAQIDGCLAAACVTIDGRTHVCSCDAGDQGDRFTLTHGGNTVSWPAEIPTQPANDEWFMQGGIADFHVSRIDIDRDGDTELVVAQLRETDDTRRSTWDVAIVDDLQQAVAPLRMTLGNYGQGTFVTNTTGSCDLFATGWELHRPDTASSDRWYLVGRRLGYDNGVVVPTDEDVLARRLLYSFTPTLVGGPTHIGAPAADLGTNKAEQRNAEPVTAHERVEIFKGKITAASDPTVPGTGPTLILEAGDSTLALTAWPEQERSDGYQRLGDVKTGQLYPLGYTPTGGAETLVGTKVAAVTYRVSSWQSQRVLWLSR